MKVYYFFFSFIVADCSCADWWIDWSVYTSGRPG